jgi:WD40 repeat protein
MNRNTRMKKMRTIVLVISLLIAGSLLLSACNNEGVAAFSPGNDWVAVITADQHLFTTDMNGGSPIKVEQSSISTQFDVTFDPIGSKLLYVANDGICLSNARATTTCTPIYKPPTVPSMGFLSFLPNGQFIFATKPDKWNMAVYNTNGGVVFQEPNIDHFFLTSDAYKVKHGSNGTEWMLTPYAKQNLRVVFTRGSEVKMYNFSGQVEGPAGLGPINDTIVTLLNSREAADITSGVVSPDGTKMVFRTKTGSDQSPSFGLYLVNLTQGNALPTQLVSNANFRIQFAFSPDSQELAYESNEGGRSVWIIGANGSNKRKLADNASLPDWR